MKYILMPILKLIWAILLTLVCGICVTIGFTVLTLWTLKLDFDWTVIADTQSHTSPYWIPNEKYGKCVEFKTVFHFIWGIKSGQRKLY